MSELSQMAVIGITALVFIVMLKIAMAKFPIPGLSELVAMA